MDPISIAKGLVALFAYSFYNFVECLRGVCAPVPWWLS